ncbi:putative beta-eliminating lyase [Fusarium oxysporum f. sp. narcissi]|uniref:Putative beta-eliminating lyase n=1 Tax=Fusarium oxysporum f. sp. narcissi TaxID=451672 RepID=A0A4Q2VC08_FUSOX|nr:putative beta-eliminating lyase [Fusarium oxysporum f. sp. narcissi]
MTETEFQVPTWRIRMVEEIRRSTRRQRQKWISEAHYNLLNLEGNQVFIDLLTDSGTGAISSRQWTALMRENDIFAGSSPSNRVKEKVRFLFGLEHVLPLHQGQGEHMLFSLLIGENNVVPANCHSNTSRAHIECRKATAVDCPVDEAFCIENYHPFKGNIDIQKLEYVLHTNANNVPFVLVSVTCNMTGGQPVSIKNLSQVKHLARQYGVPVVLNSARFAENAWFIQQREPNYASMTITEIVREMHQYADAMIMSGEKNGLMDAGSILAMRDHTWFEAASTSVPLFEEDISHGGMTGRHMELLMISLDEDTCENQLRSRVGQVERFGEKLKKAGIPIQQPVGGNAIVIDAASFLPHVPREEFVAQTLAVELYLEAGVRGVEIGTLMNDRDPVTGDNRYADVEFMRLAVPRRVYMDEHLGVVAKALMDIYERRSTIKDGLHIVSESRPLRYLTVTLEKVAEENEDAGED